MKKSERNDSYIVDDLIKARNLVLRRIKYDREIIKEIEEELRIARHKPAKSITCEQMIEKIANLKDEIPIVVYENNIPKKITKVIVSDNHVRIEISPNNQIEYKE